MESLEPCRARGGRSRGFSQKRWESQSGWRLKRMLGGVRFYSHFFLNLWIHQMFVHKNASGCFFCVILGLTVCMWKITGICSILHYVWVTPIPFSHFCLLAKLTFTGLLFACNWDCTKTPNLFLVQYEDFCEYSLIYQFVLVSLQIYSSALRNVIWMWSLKFCKLFLCFVKAVSKTQLCCLDISCPSCNVVDILCS